jgi:hypothetical protein
VEQTQSKFEGWAVVELFGHQREVGFVTTEYYGAAAMFRIDTPELPEREYELERPEWTGSQYAPKGSKVKREGSRARSRLVGPGAVYALNPCSEKAALAAIEKLFDRPLILVELPKERALPPGSESVSLAEQQDLNEPSEDDIDEDCR